MQLAGLTAGGAKSVPLLLQIIDRLDAIPTRSRISVRPSCSWPGDARDPRGAENRPRNPQAPATPSADPPRSVPIAPSEASKGLKTLKTARGNYWLELAWIWDRRHVRSRLRQQQGVATAKRRKRGSNGGGSGGCHVSRFIHQGRPKAGPEFAMTLVETSWILREMSSVTILLNTRGTQPGQSKLVDRDLPTQELIDGERITRACFLERKQATAHRGHDLGFASDHPPLGRRRGQIGDRQRASVRAYDVFHPRSKRFTHLTLTTQRNCLCWQHRGLGLRFA